MSPPLLCCSSLRRDTLLWAEAAEDGAAEDTPEDESDLDRDSRRSDREALVSRREPTSRSLARSWKEMVQGLFCHS